MYLNDTLADKIGSKLVRSLRVLGVTINCRLTATDHVNNLLSSTASLLHAPQILRCHCVPASLLQDIFRATVVAKVTYCAPAWSGTCSAADRTRLDSFPRRCKRQNLCLKDLLTVTELFDDADKEHFSGESSRTLNTYCSRTYLNAFQSATISWNGPIASPSFPRVDCPYLWLRLSN